MRGAAGGLSDEVAARVAALPPLREAIAAAGLSATKALGQNFLLDANLLDRLVRVAALPPASTVYEVGPGPGGLTRALLRAGHRVFAVERDARAVAALAPLIEAADGRLTVVEGDALIAPPADAPAGAGHIVGNLPYNIGTHLLTGWLGVDGWPPWWRSCTLMFQREVAERIVAAPGSDAYGRLAVLAQWRSAAKIVLTVPRQAFTPAPKVDSAAVRIVPTPAPPGVEPRRLEALTQAAFGQRRKMLRQSLKSIPGALDRLAALGIDPARRAETLAVADFVQLAASTG